MTNDAWQFLQNLKSPITPNSLFNLYTSIIRMGKSNAFKTSIFAWSHFYVPFGMNKAQCTLKPRPMNSQLANMRSRGIEFPARCMGKIAPCFIDAAPRNRCCSHTPPPPEIQFCNRFVCEMHISGCVSTAAATQVFAKILV